MSRLLPLVVVASIATLGLAVGSGSACPPSAHITDDCDVSGDRTVATGATLKIEDAKVRFTQDGTLTVAGSLELMDATIEAADGVKLHIRFLPGSSVQVKDSAITGHASLQVAGGIVVDNLTLQSSATALEMEAPAQLHDVAITARDGVRVAAGTQLTLVGGSITASRDAVVAAEGASVRLEDTVQSSGSVRLEGTAVFEAFWSVALNVTADGGGAVMASFRDVAGVVQESGSVPLGQPKSFLLPGQARTVAGTVSFSPYFVSVVQGTNANHTHLNLVGTEELDVHVPIDSDDADPQWSIPAPPLHHDGAFPGFSGDGTVHLAWSPADDTLGGQHANRAVGHYEVFVGGVKAAETRATSFLVEGLGGGVHTLRVDAVDLVGNRKGSNPLDVLVDTGAPALSFDADPAPSALGAHAGPVTVTVDAGDPGSGLRALRWRIGGGAFTPLACTDDDPCLSKTFQVPLEAPGVHPLHVVAQDRAGTTTEAVHNITIDTSPPLFIASVKPHLPTGAWHREAPSLHVNHTDAGPSGPGHIRWRLGNESWQNHTGPAPLEAVGEHTIHVEVTDGAGNVARTQLRHAYDPEAPELEVAVTGPRGLADWFTGFVNVTADAGDGLSGVERLEYRLSAGAWRPFLRPVALQEDGLHAITFRATDAAGNEAVEDLKVSIDSQPPQPPGVAWSVLSDGRIRADWARSPPLDAASGVASLRIERGTQRHDVSPTALGHVLVGLPAAEHTLRVVATDAAGHESATAWQTVRGGNGTGAAASAQDARGIVRLLPDAAVRSDDLLEVRYHIDGSLAASQSQPPYELRWDTRSLANGPHDVRIVAVDAGGIHHEELRTYDLRNGYVAALADGAWAVAAALTVAIGAAAAAVNGLRSWRREVVA